MGNTEISTQQESSLATQRPLDWLMIYTIEANGGITDDWLKRSRMERSEAQRLLNENPEARREVRQLLQLGRLMDLRMMFGLLLQRTSEMLAAATKPADVRSLTGTLQQLRQVEIIDQRELKRVTEQIQRPLSTAQLAAG
ncbi:hypothetical protein KDL44_00950 [bacterium]|nr:hypothetical protein [bacterium]